MPRPHGGRAGDCPSSCPLGRVLLAIDPPRSRVRAAAAQLEPAQWALSIFHSTNYTENSKSLMSARWCMEHGPSALPRRPILPSFPVLARAAVQVCRALTLGVTASRRECNVHQARALTPRFDSTCSQACSSRSTRRSGSVSSPPPPPPPPPRPLPLLAPGERKSVGRCVGRLVSRVPPWPDLRLQRADWPTAVRPRRWPLANK